MFSGDNTMNQQHHSTATNKPEQVTRQMLIQKLTDFSMAEEGYVQIIELKQNDVLFNQGDPGDSLYVLLAGMLGVRQRHDDGTETEIDKLAPGAVVGELALLSGQQRTATVYTVNDCRVLRLTRRGFDQLSPAEKEALIDMEDTLMVRWQRLQLSKVLGNLFGQLSANDLHMIQEQLEWYHLSNGDILFHQGDVSDGMYVVLNGRLRYTASDSQGKIVASSEVGSGETIGEFALITQEYRSATVFAVRETNLVKLTPDVFANFVRDRPQIMGHLTRIIVERQQQNLQRKKTASHTQLTVAIVPAGPAIDTFSFAQALAEAMAGYGDTLPLNAQQFNSLTDQQDAAQTAVDSPYNPAVVAMLEELETRYNYLLYIADAELTNWTRRCLGQADRVLLLANPDHSPHPGEVEQWLAQFEVPIRTELALWHEPQTERPQGTAVWLDKRQVHTHHHIRQGDGQHMARLARRLTGQAIGLVLSGGAARGYAHVGVFRALDELNIPIDYVGCTSMGAVVGGSIVKFQTHKELESVYQVEADPKQFFDRTLPIASLMASHKITQFLQRSFEDLLIEDQWTPFFCVASNLTTAEPVVYQRGPLWRAIRASISIPGVFTPVMQDGDVIVDGGVIDNFPAATMAALCESERIIGVNISPHQDKKRVYDFDTGISGWRILFSRLNPFTKSLRAPSMVGVILRTLEINSTRRAKEEEALVDVMIYPDVKKFKTTDYALWEAIAQAGYEAAIAPLTEWKQERLSGL
jgi:predicted acylesterase/phospholipase RssA/CRP-like cAMP-binding protein